MAVPQLTEQSTSYPPFEGLNPAKTNLSKKKSFIELTKTLTL